MEKIGIMGGTFDPIHNGHLLLGRQAYEEYDLDQIWYMPSGHPPHKRDHKVTSAADRCAMVKLALRSDPRFRLSDFEISREGKTYTAQTLSLLKQDYPECDFYFIIGADSLYEIETWFHPEEVLSAARLLVADRDYQEAHAAIDQQIAMLSQKYSCDIRKLHCRKLEASSEQIRQLVGQGKTIRPYVPADVEAYIMAHHLYQEVSLR